MVKTYEILRLLTDEEIERMLAETYEPSSCADSLTLVANLGSRDEPCYVCPLGVALVKGYSPTPRGIANSLYGRGYGFIAVQDMARTFVIDVDSGRIRPEDLAEIVRLSREG